MAQDQRIIEAAERLAGRPEAQTVETIEDTVNLPGMVWTVLEVLAAIGGGITGAREEDVVARLFTARLAVLRQAKDAFSHRQNQMIAQTARQVSDALAVLEEHDLAFLANHCSPLYPRYVVGNDGYKVLSFLRDRQEVVEVCVLVAAEEENWVARQVAEWEAREEEAVYLLAAA